MDELVQDLVSALDDSSLKQDISDQCELSPSTIKTDRDMYRKRRMRKRRTISTSSHLVSNRTNNLVIVSQINNSPRSSSSLDEAMKDYVESFTANCSDESEECVKTWKSRLENAVLSSGLQDRVHHKRVFKQARPCCCESDSHTENGAAAIPVLRRHRHRKKKLKRMTIENGALLLLHDSQGPTSGSCDEGKRRKQAKKNTPYPSAKSEVNEKMCCKTTKVKKERKTAISCLFCYRKSCDKLQNNNMSVATNGTNGNETLSDLKAVMKDENVHTYQCTCNANYVKDESSISGSSSNSETDSANFTPDDIGGDGDDEMTDFYAESDGGSISGIPHICELPWIRRGQGLTKSKEETIWAFKMMDDLEISGASNALDPRVKRFVPGSMHYSETSRRGFHARYNRLPGMAARSIRRGRRRAKVKKAKEKTLREQDFHSSLSKLSLSARSKRIRLDGFNRQDWTSHKQFIPLPLSQSSVPKTFETNAKDKMDIPEEKGIEEKGFKTISSTGR